MPPQLDRLRDAIADGARGAAARLAEVTRLPWAIEVEGVAVCGLSDFPEKALVRLDPDGSEAECLATVVVGLDGPRPGAALLALEPESALSVLRSTAGGDALGDPGRAIARYMEIGAELLAELARPLGVGLATGDERASCLREEPLVASVLGTHPPPHTMIVSAALVFANEADGFVGHAYFLVDPKTREAIESWLASVS